MQQGDESRLATPDRPRRKLWRLLIPLFAACAVVFVVVMSVPVMDGPHRRQHGNEASTVGMLSTITELQSNYAAAHPGQGFACDLARLKSTGPVKDPYYDPEEFLVTGTRSGYRLKVADCRADSNGVVIHYQVTAVPLEPGKSGFRAFCTDESGSLWYDEAGSAANCLAARRPVF